MRSSDLLLAFPGLLLAIIATAMFGATTLTAMVGIGLANVPGFARISRAAALTVMSLDYVAAARTAKRGSLYIATRHVLPNITGVIIVQASVSFALAILAEAGLSFLGLGTPPPDPSWGGCSSRRNHHSPPPPTWRCGRGWRSQSRCWGLTY